MSRQVFSPARLRLARERAGLRREAVALAINRSADMVSAYETTRDHRPPTDVLERLAAVLGIDIGEMFEHVNGGNAR